MATTLENLIAARDAAVLRLRSAMETATEAGYKPNTNSPNSVDHVGHTDRLMRLIESLDRQIDSETSRSDPLWLETKGELIE